MPYFRLLSFFQGFFYKAQARPRPTCETVVVPGETNVADILLFTPCGAKSVNFVWFLFFRSFFFGCTGHDAKSLLFSLLDEFLFLFHSEGLAVKRTAINGTIVRDSGPSPRWRLKATA